ncbi:hypothetical protein [Microcoleus sp. K5-D4]|uniref:hypothetical protein n=1 Tax=Microcoleus sp. K5-D4 TaxID=2818801 RepID=UPI002FD49268
MTMQDYHRTAADNTVSTVWVLSQYRTWSFSWRVTSFSFLRISLTSSAVSRI